MEKRLLSGPAEDPAEEGSGAAQADREPHGNASGGRRETGIPDVDACLRALAQLPGLVALGLLKPAQANTIRATFREILQHHRQSQRRDERQGLSDANVLDLLRANPEILSLLEPLLTDEQIAMVMRDGGSDAGE